MLHRDELYLARVRKIDLWALEVGLWRRRFLGAICYTGIEEDW
jgi:hypothetical protein